jgi:hypothetical protein
LRATDEQISTSRTNLFKIKNIKISTFQESLKYHHEFERTFVESRVSIIPFQKENNWHMWLKQFLAQAEHQGYADIVLALETPPPDSLITTDKALLKLCVSNRRGYSELLLSFNDEVNLDSSKKQLLQISLQEV